VRHFFSSAAFGLVLATAAGWTLAAGAGVDLQTCRPRLFFRQTAWTGGLSVAQLRERARQPPFNDRIRLLRTTLANLAMKWMIEDGADTAEKTAQECLTGMKKWDCGISVSDDGVQLIDLALAYDWLFAWRGFSDADKRSVEAKMVKAATAAKEELSGPGAHVYHTRMYAWTAAVGVVGLAIHDRDRAGRDLFLFSKRYYEERLVPARRLQGGAWHPGPLYAMNAMMLPLLQYLEAAKSAAGIDYFHTPDPAQSDWLREMPYFMIYVTQPDLRTVYYADLTTRTPDKHFRFGLDIFATEYRNGYAAELARRISETYKTTGYHAEYIYLSFAFYDPTVAPKPLDDLPTFRVFGRDGPGHVLYHSHWKPDAMVVQFRCGDYFDDHGHFDQGSFTIFKGQDLALKSGFYDFASDHRLHYFKQAISTNTVIFQDPRDTADEGRQRNVRYQEANTFEDYLKRKTTAPFLETGNILAVDDPAWATSSAKDFHAVAADVTPAWEARKVKRYVRRLAVLDGRHVVIVDETETTSPEIRARWLLHTAERPTLDGDVWAVRAAKTVLFVQPLLPASPKVTLIGGPGHECDVNGTNWTYLTAAKFKSYNRGVTAPIPALGLWRTEVEAPAPAARRLFVTVLSAADAGAPPPAAETVLAVPDLTVTIENASVTFHRIGG
jgi:hypothetical protein